MSLYHLAERLRQLFRNANLPAEAEVAAVAARLQGKVLALVNNLPAMPDTALRAVQLANDQDSRFADFARLIEADAAVATGILRVANSALYGGRGPAVKLQHAVVRLGMQTCKSLIVAIGVRSLFKRLPGDAQRHCAALWRHGYVTAALCRRINLACDLGLEGEEFSAGLLHDLGRVLLALADPECFAQSGGLDFQETADVLGRERRAIGTDHGELGGWFGEHSRLPPALVEVMRFHHDPGRAGAAPGLVELVATADHLANYLQRGEDVGTYDPAESLGLTCLWARWPPEKRARLLDQLPALTEEALRAADGEGT